MLLRWVGGKSLLADQIIGTFPPHKRYIEPFFGAGWVFFTKEKADENIINDVNSDLTNLYTIVRDNPQDLARLLYYTPKSEDEFNRIVSLYNTPEWARQDPVRRALSFLFLVKVSFNGLCKIYSTFASWNSGILETLERVSQKLQNVDILNRDWKDILMSYANKDTLVYLDPPYAVTMEEKNYYYKYILTKDEHIEMKAFLTSSLMKEREFKYVISYDIHPMVEELWGNQPGIWMYKTKATHQSSINANALTVEKDTTLRFKQEYLITNFSIQESLPLFYER